MKYDIFDSKFNEPEFKKFITELLPDFEEERRPIISNGILKKLKMLGVSEKCQLVVITARVKMMDSNKRITITHEAFRILGQHRIRNALVAFYSEQETWRLSLLTSNLEIKDGKIVSKTSNPRRYSYLLGPSAKTKTPRKFLSKQGQVESLEDLQKRFSVEVVNKQFYGAIVAQFIKLVGNKYTKECALKMPEGQNDESAIFAVRLIGRIIFSWFLKEKCSDDGVSLMPKSLLSSNAVRRHPDYYHNVLEPVFFGCLNTKFGQRREALKRAPFNQIPYLNGGLFNPQISDFYETSQNVTIDDKWFEELFEVLEQYNFTVDENTNSDTELSIDPEMLGRIFENLLAEISPETGESARKATGSYYTPREIVAYMVDEALCGFLERETKLETEKITQLVDCDKAGGVELTNTERETIVGALSRLKVLDPACGSGAFLIGILQKVFYILQQVDQDGCSWYKEQIEQESSPDIADDLRMKFKNANHDYIRKLGIIRQNIFGVDIQSIAMEITKLRCFLTLIIEEDVDDTKPNRGIHPLPNLDFKFVTANTLKFLPENPNDPFNMFENGKSVELVKKIRNDYFLADKTGRIFLKTEFSEAQNEIAQTKQELARMRYRDLAKWQPFVGRLVDWFDSEWMFGVKSFDIVISNPPYGAKLAKDEQVYCLEHYKAAHSENGLKGSLDTFVLFVERGLDLIKKGGLLAYIVPMSITSNEAVTALQNEMEQKCEKMKIVSFADRPRQIFENANVRTSIIFCEKTNTAMKELYMTRQMRRKKDESIRDLIDRIEIIEAHKYKLYGRYPKVGNAREIKILEKIFAIEKCVRDYADKKSTETFYYRAAGGRYFNIVTLTQANVSAEREYRARYADLIAACLSTSLFWFYQQIYTDGFNLKAYEIDRFPLPDFEKIDTEILKKIRQTYLRYLNEIDKYSISKNVEDESRYNIQTFKEYKLKKSKGLIDELDTIIDPLYGLGKGEVEYIQQYEKDVRMNGE